MGGDSDVFVAIGDPDRLLPRLQAFLAARYGGRDLQGDPAGSQSGQRCERIASHSTLQKEKQQDERAGDDKANSFEAVASGNTLQEKLQDESAGDDKADDFETGIGANAAWFDLTDDASVAVESAEVADGGIEEVPCQTKAAELLRFHTSKSGNEQVSLKEYVERMKGNQHGIYHITGASITAVASAPQVKALRKKSWEVLYIVDPVDLFCVQQLKEFDGKPFKSASKEDLGIGSQGSPSSRHKVAQVLRFHTSKSGGAKVSLQEYVDRMKECQNDIYCVMGNGIADVTASPLVQALRRKGLEVLYLVDPAEEYCVQQLQEVDGKHIKCLRGADMLRFHSSGSGDKEVSLEASKDHKKGGQYDIDFVTGVFNEEYDGGSVQLEETIAECLRLHSSESGDDQISLKEYVDFMPEG